MMCRSAWPNTLCRPPAIGSAAAATSPSSTSRTPSRGGLALRGADQVERAGPVVQQRRVGQPQRRRDRGVALVAGRADGVEARALRCAATARPGPGAGWRAGRRTAPGSAPRSAPSRPGWRRADPGRRARPRVLAARSFRTESAKFCSTSSRLSAGWLMLSTVKPLRRISPAEPVCWASRPSDMNSLPRRAPIATVALLAAGVTGCAGRGAGRLPRWPARGRGTGQDRGRRHRPPGR